MRLDNATRQFCSFPLQAYFPLMSRVDGATSVKLTGRKEHTIVPFAKSVYSTMTITASSLTIVWERQITSMWGLYDRPFGLPCLVVMFRLSVAFVPH